MYFLQRSHQYTVINRHLLWNREELNLSLRIFSPTNITNYSTVPFVGADGLEPPTSCVSDRYSNQTELHTHKFFSNRKYLLLSSHIGTFDVISGLCSVKLSLYIIRKELLSREQESNLQPADYKSAALPIELSRHIFEPLLGEAF